MTLPRSPLSRSWRHENYDVNKLLPKDLNLTSLARSHVILMFLWNQYSLNSLSIWPRTMANHWVASTGSSQSPRGFIISSRSSWPSASKPDAFERMMQNPSLWESRAIWPKQQDTKASKRHEGHPVISPSVVFRWERSGGGEVCARCRQGRCKNITLTRGSNIPFYSTPSIFLENCPHFMSKIFYMWLDYNGF